MRGWQTVCIVGVVLTAAAVGHGRTVAAQILQYTEAGHSRNEAGVPGNNVTGGWSWVDHHGQQHHIWYVADTRGFRAFGDLVPKAAKPMNVGVPVVVAIPLASLQEKTTKTSDVPQPVDKPRAERNLTPELSKGGGQDKEMKTDSATKAEVSTLPPVTSTTTDILDLDTTLLKDVTEQPETIASAGEGSGDTIITTTTTPSTTTTTTTSTTTTTTTAATPANTATSIPEAASQIPVTSSTPCTTTEPIEELPIPQPLIDDKQHGSPKSLAPSESGSADEKAPDQLPDASFHSPKQSTVTPSGNNFVASVFNKLSTALGAPDDNMQKPRLHQEPQNGLESITPDPEQHSTSDFVLINRLRAPTIPKPRVGSQQLVPKPVNVMGRTDSVVMGLHSSGRPSTSRPLTHTTEELKPLGIHLLNLVPIPKKTASASRPVPRPVRVVGEPNLDNFWRPAGLARTTVTPFRQPRPSRDYDYHYYDYYDYNDYRGENTGGPVTPTQKTKSKTVRSNSEEYSLETDYSDSEESEDSSDNQ
ncbi:flocculation protein FLO11-like [Portunus trituberculatus]|uniref:flocculation protein FLO11-like n=1 Tax=Portunus trituberculatus TaxID=210409 RepID=UPI001E1D1AED|nr:flocculation protein FLO11-like [Portunus trituberculatus]